jgi:hypothetical protein
MKASLRSSEIALYFIKKLDHNVTVSYTCTSQLLLKYKTETEDGKTKPAANASRNEEHEHGTFSAPAHRP